MPLLRLDYKRLSLLSFWHSPSGSFCQLVQMEKAIWQGNEGSFWSTAHRNWILLTTMQVTLEMDPSPVEPSDETSPLTDTSAATLWETLRQKTQLKWVPNSWKLWDNKCYCFKSLSFGVICYTATENEISSNEALIRCTWDLLFYEVGRLPQEGCKTGT